MDQPTVGIDQGMDLGGQSAPGGLGAVLVHLSTGTVDHHDVSIGGQVRFRQPVPGPGGFRPAFAVIVGSLTLGERARVHAGSGQKRLAISLSGRLLV